MSQYFSRVLRYTPVYIDFPMFKLCEELVEMEIALCQHATGPLRAWFPQSTLGRELANLQIADDGDPRRQKNMSVCVKIASMGEGQIKDFAQMTLGCGCPEEVFRHIDCKSDISVGDVLLKSRINIGNRLLVYIVEIHDMSSIRRVVNVLVGAGVKDRNESGFNRFRLVLATDDPAVMKETAESIFADIAKDDKVHLHVISRKDIPVNG
jgi:hypothetical protein